MWPFEPEISHLVFLGVAANSSLCTRASNFRRNLRHQSGACHDLQRWSGWCSALRAGLSREKSALHPEKLLLWLWHRHVGWVCSNLWQHHKQRCFWTAEPRGDCISFTGGGCGLSLRKSGCGLAKGSQGFTRAVVCGRWHQAIFSRFTISVWCEDLQHSGRGTSWIRSSERSFNQCSWPQQTACFLREVQEGEN